jgi:hypothetical protein
MQQTVRLPQDLYDAVDKQAKTQRKTADGLVVEWVVEKIGETELAEVDTAFEQEVATFETLKPELLAQYPNQYIAIYQGQVVGNGDNRLALVKEVYNQFGEVPCYVEKVTLEPPRRVRMPSVRKAKWRFLMTRIMTRRLSYCRPFCQAWCVVVHRCACRRWLIQVRM